MFERLMDEHKPTRVVCEEYRVYGWRTRQHAWSELHTPQLIGALRAIAAQRGIPVVLQGAGLAKGFVSDAKLRAWGLYRSGMRHAMDAVRHACYYLLFGRKKK